jgi:hypothetical protein
MKTAITSLAAALVLSGCVAMREQGKITLPQIHSSKPTASITADYRGYKNGQRWVFMEQYTKKDLLKKARKKANQTGLFGNVYLSPYTPEKSDLNIYCNLRLDRNYNVADYWISSFTFSLYPWTDTYQYTLRTHVTDNRTGQKKTFVSSDAMSVHCCLLFLPAAPFKNMISATGKMEQYLFDDTIRQIALAGFLNPKGNPNE